MEAGGITREQKIKRIQNYISRMPSLSTTVAKVLEICNKPDTSPNDLNRVISLDPVLTGKVLNLINSAYYSMPGEITSLTRAIIMLGINTVKNLALSTSVMESIGGNESFQAFSMDDFWAHSICTGVTAKSLAKIKGVPASAIEEFFVAGLLHDLGKIPLNSQFPDDYARVMELAEQTQESLYNSEIAVFEIDHCIIGGMIADKWRLNHAIIESITHHHSSHEIDYENAPLVSIVELADMYANGRNNGNSETFFSEDPVAARLLNQVGIKPEKVSGLHEMVSNEIENAKVFLKLSEKD